MDSPENAFLFRWYKIQIGQEIDAHLNLFFRQGLVHRLGIGRHITLDEVTLLDREDVHQISIAANLPSDQKLRAMSGFPVGDLHFIHVLK